MPKELIIFVPGLTARTPGKDKVKLFTNIENVVANRGGAFRSKARPALSGATRGAAGGAFDFEVEPPDTEGETRQYVFREVVWGDIPTRLSELSAWQKFKQGARLLIWAFASLVSSPRAMWSNKFQSFCLLGSLLILVLWYIGVVVAVPSAIPAALPASLADPLRDFLKAFGGAAQGVSVWGTSLWVLTSTLMLLFPVTAMVDAAYGMKQYVGDGRTEAGGGLVGEEARVRIANALSEAKREQDSGEQPAYGRITVLAHSFGAVLALEALAVYQGKLGGKRDGKPVDGAVRLITLGAPIAFAGAIRPSFSGVAGTLRDTGRAAGIALSSWRCVWSRWDYLSSNPGRSPWGGFRGTQIEGSWSRSIFSLAAYHERYFEEDRVAEAILDLDAPVASVPASPPRTHVAPASPPGLRPDSAGPTPATGGA